MKHITTISSSPLDATRYTTLIKYDNWYNGESPSVISSIDIKHINTNEIIKTGIWSNNDILIAVDFYYNLLSKGVKNLFIDSLNNLDGSEIVKLFEIIFNNSNKLLNFRSAIPLAFKDDEYKKYFRSVIPLAFKDDEYEKLVAILKNNYKIFVSTYFPVSIEVVPTNALALSQSIIQYNIRNVSGWNLVYSSVICLLCVGRFGGLGSGWKEIFPMLARFVHSTRYESCWYTD